MRKAWKVIAGLSGFVATGVVVCTTIAACSFLNYINSWFYPGLNNPFSSHDVSDKISEFGVLKDKAKEVSQSNPNAFANENTVHANQTVMSLRFNMRTSRNTAINIYGSGWIFDFELEDNVRNYDQATIDDIKTFYIATNMHVIGLVAAAAQDVKLTIGSTQLGQSPIVDYNEGFRNSLVFSKTATAQSKILPLKEAEVNQYSPGTYTILPVGIKDEAINYGADSSDLNALRNHNKASDFAIIKITPTRRQKKEIPFFRNFKPIKGIGFGNVILNKQKLKNSLFYSAGYPHFTAKNSYDGDYSYYHQYANYATGYIDSFSDAKTYRNDNPIVFGNKIAFYTQDNKPFFDKNLKKYPYHSYDIPTQGFDLGPGASGSPVFDINNNIIGIYWGGVRVVDITNNKAGPFYGNFTPIFFNDNVSNINQDLIKNYLAFTKRSNTYLDTNYNTNILTSNFDNNTFLEYLKHLKQLVSRLHAIEQREEGIYAKGGLIFDKSQNQSDEFEQFVKTYTHFIYSIVNPKFLNKEHGLLPDPSAINQIKVIWDKESNIGLKISFVHNKEVNNKIVPFNTTFTLYNDPRFPVYSEHNITQVINNLQKLIQEQKEKEINTKPTPTITTPTNQTNNQPKEVRNQ
ncbi:hypothetical protein JM47_02820 [Ureaplasma diversum]|uniref:DUF31 domain-containing protein n=1 Tax=Ureaplasma diversum TaxID=42094 RepID=A0A0C5RM53_9BACT|nr:hypothetical protein [Ureaplasma diversum]AJQ45487.1 hypothetical protein JM47_02820 [Ureaplasma diversum]